MKKTALYLAALPLLFVGCSFEETPSKIDGMPEITNEGANVVAFKINDQMYISRGEEKVKSKYYFKDDANVFWLHSKVGFNAISSIEFHGKLIDDTLEVNQTYVLNDANPGFSGVVSFLDQEVFIKEGYTNANYTGELTITYLNTQNHIISGTFWFDVKNPITGEVTQVRDGRFDVKYTDYWGS